MGSSMINYQDLPVCLDSSAKKVLLLSASMREIGNVPDDLAAVFDFISYHSAEKAVIKALGSIRQLLPIVTLIAYAHTQAFFLAKGWRGCPDVEIDTLV